jgi:hypothetical protein
MLQVIPQGINAQETAVYEGLTYYLDKKEAFDAATVQGKQVFLFWGSIYCSRCNKVKENLARKTFASLLQDHYILWYCDVSDYARDAPEVIDYLSAVETPHVPYPALCVIDTIDITKAHGLICGDDALSVYQLYEMLTRYKNVANDDIKGDYSLNNAYISQNRLIVKSDVAKEEIVVYAVTGSQVDKFNKTEQVLTRDASSYPSGILIVAGSSGWARKVILKRN